MPSPLLFPVHLPKLSKGGLSRLALVAAAFSLAACAAVPKSSTDTPFKAEDLASSQSLTGEAGAWPSQDWWKGFNDPQLNALMDEAFRNAPDLKAAQARLKKATAFNDQIRAALDPSLTLNGSVAASKQSYNMGFPPAFQSFLPHDYWYSDRLSLDANYDIDLWGKSHAALKGALGQARAASLEAEVAKQDIASQVASAYVELDRLYQERDDLAELKHGADIHVELEQARIANNLDSKDALLATQDDQAKVVQRLAAVDGAIRLQGNLIAALLGAGPDRGLAITRPALAPVAIDTLPADIRVNLIGRRPDVQAARLHVEAAGEQIKYTRADFYPNVKLNAYFGLQALGKTGLGLGALTTDGSDIGSIGPAISLPLFSGGRLKAQYRSSEADYDQAVATYDQTLTHALQQVANAAASSQSTSAQLAAVQTRVNSAQGIYEMSKARFAKGLATKIDVLGAHSQLIAAQLEQSNLKAQAYNDRIRFIAALGGGFQSQ